MCRSCLLLTSCFSLLFTLTISSALSVVKRMAASVLSDKTKYLDAFRAYLSAQQADAILDKAPMPQLSSTRASLHSRIEHKSLRLENVSPRDTDRPAPGNSVLIVENVDSHWIAALGVAWDISPSFFAEHVSNPRGTPLWQAIFGTSAFERAKPTTKEVTPDSSIPQFWDKAHYWNVDGVLRYTNSISAIRTKVATNYPSVIRREGENSDIYGLHKSTRISCWQCSDKNRSFC